jgi:hypothetical protein
MNPPSPARGRTSLYEQGYGGQATNGGGAGTCHARYSENHEWTPDEEFNNHEWTLIDTNKDYVSLRFFVWV